MSRRITAFLLAVLIIAAIAAYSFTKKGLDGGPMPPWTEAALVEMGDEAIPQVRARCMSQAAESIDAVALTFLARSQSDEADELLVDMIRGGTEVDRVAALEMLLFELPEADRRSLTTRPKVRAALLENAESGSQRTRAFINTMRAEDGF